MNPGDVIPWSMNDVIYYVVFNLSRAVLAFLQFDSYLYWPFLVSTIVLVVLIALQASINPKGIDWGGWRLKLLALVSPQLWWHPSARADYKLYICNALIHPALMVPLLVSNNAFAGWLDGLLGLTNSAHAEGLEVGWGMRLTFTIVFFVAYDLGRFLAHWLQHDVPFLWSFHKVHHSAEVLTPITSFRLHPVDLLLMAWIPTLLTGLTTWFFNRLSGGSVDVFSFLGLHVIIWTFNLVDNLRHSPVWLSYGTRVGQWLVSPAHHQLHHSMEPVHWGCNLGSNLAIWDRLHGSLYVPGSRPEKFRMGLGDGSEARWHGLSTIYFQPFRESFQCAKELVKKKRSQV